MPLNNSCLCRSQTKISEFCGCQGATALQALVLGTGSGLDNYAPNAGCVHSFQDITARSPDKTIIQRVEGGT